MKAPAVLLILLALFFSGCSSVQTRRNPTVDLGHYQRFFVERRLNDDHHLDEMIVAELRAQGREASSGPLTMMPDETDALVTYQDDWAWDFKSYLIELHLQIRDARKDLGLAAGSYRQPSLFSKRPAAVIHAIVTGLFKHS